MVAIESLTNVHAAPAPDRLEPVRDAGEAADRRRGVARARAGQVRAEGGGEDVVEHRDAGEPHVGDRQQRFADATRITSPAAVAAVDGSSAAYQRTSPSRRGAELAAAGIVGVEDDGARARQLGQPRLHGAVGGHRAVAVDVVGADVRVDRHLRAARDRRQLQLGQLEDRPGRIGQLVGTLDQRGADVPAQDARDAGRLEDGGDERGGRRLALRAGDAHDPRPRQAQEELDLADLLQPAPLRLGEQVAQPGLGGREARRDRRRGDEQVGGVHRLGQRRRVDAEEQVHRPPVERRDGVGEVGGRAAVVGRHERAGIGQEAGRGDPGACQPEDERAAPGQVGAAANRSDGGGHGHAL